MDIFVVQKHYFRKTLAKIGIGCLLVLGSSAISAAPLLATSSVGASDVQESALSAEVVRTRAVTVNTSLFGGGSAFDRPPGGGGDEVPTVVDIDLFDGTSVSAALFPAVSGMAGMQAWSGNLVDDQDSEVLIVVNGDIVQSNIHSGKYGDYQIRYLEGTGDQALHDLREIDPEGFPQDHPPEWSDVEQSAGGDAVHDHTLDFSAGNDGATVDGGDQTDIMVVYTPAARSAVGGTSAMQTLIGLATAATNNSYVNSNIVTRLNVTHTAEVSYTESGSFGTDLNRLIAPADGFMDNVHSLRSTHKADMVGLLTNSTSFCGLASSILASASNAFHVTYHGCAVGNMSYAHEFGHLQGARHDWAVDGSSTPYVYGHGYTPGSGWRTVMAYSNSCASSCPRIQHWSNPDVSYGGAPAGPTGISGGATPSDNARVLDNTRHYIANFMQGQNPPAMTLPFAGSTLAGSSQNFNWQSETTNTYYWIYAGSTSGGSQYHSSGLISGSATNYLVPGLPTDGSTVYIRLWYFEDGSSSWKNLNYTYDAYDSSLPQIITPAQGATLAASEPFVWTAQGAAVNRWWLYVGTTAGSSNIYNSGALNPGQENHFVTPIASPSGKVFVRLWYRTSSWRYFDYYYYTDNVSASWYEPFSTINNWTQVNGNWISSGGRARVVNSTAPSGERSVLGRSATNHDNVDYRAKIWKNGTSSNAISLGVRTSGGITSQGNPNNGYLFQYTTSGWNSVFKFTNGSATAISSWTSASSSVINSFGWNDIRVVMIGDRYWLIVNNYVVAMGTDGTHSDGGVDVNAWKSASGSLDLWVEYASLDVPNADLIDSLDSLPVVGSNGEDGSGGVDADVNGD